MPVAKLTVALTLAAMLAGCSDDDAAEARRAQKPNAPRPLEPANGSYSGSARTPALDTARPRFVWTWIDFQGKPATYDIQVDDDCVSGKLQRCAFASPEVNETELPLAQYRPTIPLPIGDEPPFGRRYYWRVRACAGSACSPWSRVRYVEVGRVAGDFNGDGYSDVTIGGPFIDNTGVDQGSAFVYYGDRTGVKQDHHSRIDDPEHGDGSAFGVAVAVAGDLDADGFADLVVGAAGTREHRGRAYVFHGTANGIETTPRVTVRDPDGNLGDWFGSSVAGVGDVDGDGYADLVVSASGADRDSVDWGVTFFYRGGPDGISQKHSLIIESPLPADYDHFGYALSGAGDVNGDGYADIAIGSPGIDLAGMYTGVDRGAVYVFHGGPDGPSKVPGARLEAPVPLDYDRFGFAIGTAGDVNGDGFDDVVIGAPGIDGTAADEGVAYLFVGTPFGVNPTPQAILEDPRIEVYDRFGTSVGGAGDVNRDGFDDVIVGTSGKHRGRGAVFEGTREGIDPMPAAVIHDPLGEGYNHFADSVAGAGDINGDGFDDVIIGASGSDNGGVFRGSAVVYMGTRDSVDPSRPQRLDDPDTGEHDHFGHVVAGR